MGCIEEQEPPFIVKQLQPGLYAHIQVDFSVPENLTLNVAKAKHYFFEKWLPDSGYKVVDGIDSIELYDPPQPDWASFHRPHFFPWKRNNL